MVKDEQRLPSKIRETVPCKDCAERFSACSCKCPKDARGEYGYNAWKAEVDRVKQNRNAYLVSRFEDSKRREKWLYPTEAEKRREKMLKEKQ